MCECENRIEKLKEMMIDIMGYFHDVIIDTATTEESPEWHEQFINDINQYEKVIEAI